MPPIDTRISWYCSPSMRMGAVVGVFTALAIATANIYVGIPIVIICVLIITSQYRLTIDFDRHTYHDYVWCLGIKSGEKGKFDSIQYIYITKSKVSRTMSSRVTQSSFVHDQYNSYLKFSEQDKLHLSSDDSKPRLTNTMQHLAMKLKCEVVDYSIEER